MSAILSFCQVFKLQIDTYKQWNVENAVNTQRRFGSSPRDPVFDPSPPLLGFDQGCQLGFFQPDFEFLAFLTCLAF